MMMFLCFFISFFLSLNNRIAVYKAIYPTIGTMTDVVSAIDQVTSGFPSEFVNISMKIFDDDDDDDRQQWRE